MEFEALQQRIGRGSRRENVIQAAAIYHSDTEREVLSLMFEAAANGAYRSGEYRPDLSVIVQQTLSLLYQHRTGVPRKEYLDLMSLLGTDAEVISILSYLCDKGWCMELGDAVFPSSELLDSRRRRYDPLEHP